MPPSWSTAPGAVRRCSTTGGYSEHPGPPRSRREWSTSRPSFATRGVATRPGGPTVVVQDPCHLRHVQHAHLPVGEVLGAAYDVRVTADDGLCCGAGGAYSVFEPDLSNAVRDRKVAALRAAAGSERFIVASANPGCAMHLAAAGLDVRHPAELLEDRLESE